MSERCTVPVCKSLIKQDRLRKKAIFAEKTKEKLDKVGCSGLSSPELKVILRERGVKGYSTFKKAELIGHCEGKIRKIEKPEWMPKKAKL